MTRTNIIIASIIIVILIALGIFLLYQRLVADNNTSELAASPSPIGSPRGFASTPATPSGSPRVTPTPTGSPSPTGSPRPTMSPSPTPQGQPATGDGDNLKNAGIVIDQPTTGNKVGSSVVVKGKANVFDGKVYLKVKDANGNTLGQTTAFGCMGFDACPFEGTISVNPSTSTGYIEASGTSPNGNGQTYLQTVAITF